jgi:FXSXX-COOH protein
MTKNAIVWAMSVDISDGLLLDLRSISLEDLPENDDSALGQALHRVLESNAGSAYYGFNSSI